ncbi:MAG: class I SAM-dependent methyltransferase [Actinomycetales bacterium]|nr:class I SAM-dependent methyltransferase [Actinomycetales bacterium]
MTTEVDPGSSSFRDPQNAAFQYQGQWYRIADADSAQALDRLRASSLYQSLVDSGALLAFEPIDDPDVLTAYSAYAAALTRPATTPLRVFRVATFETVTYPWEWPNTLLAAAAQHTCDLRERLLGIGLDLKDASAFNVQFSGMQPVLIDIGSIEIWRPNPGWNASRQFIEHFINPLAVGSTGTVTAADAWELGQRRGLRSEAARSVLPPKQRRRLSLALLQATTRPVASNAPSERKYADAAAKNRDLALRSTLGLTRRLAKQVQRLSTVSGNSTTWQGYGSREHYATDDLQRKIELLRDFVTSRPNRSHLVLDVGGNDGLAGLALADQAGARVVVMDADAGALGNLCQALACGNEEQRRRITPLRGDLTNPTGASGLLGKEFLPLTTRIRPSMVLCQAVLHHVVITQGVPMPLAVAALAAFGADLQVEFADEPDPKVQILLAQIPNWAGRYSLDELVNCLKRHYRHVEVAGQTSTYRQVVNAWND